MSDRPSNIPARLREGIDAAKRGDKVTARRLLQQVLSVDGDNELALMWMASVVDSVNERRFYLERALSINPNNTRAREALRRLGGEEPEVRRPTATTSPTTSTGERIRGANSSSNVYLIAAAVVGFVVVAVVVAAVVSSLQNSNATPSAPTLLAVQNTVAAFALPSNTPTLDTRPPTATTLPGIVVTLDTSLLTPLPPTFTPQPTALPSETPQPTPTVPPLSSYKLIYADIEPGASQASLYQGNADGTGEIKLASGSVDGFNDLAYNSARNIIAFVRPITEESGETYPQLFTADLSSIDTVNQVTGLKGDALAHPAFSPDGSLIAFSSDTDGSEDIWTVSTDSGALKKLTTANARNFDPQFSPDGTKIVFASDQDSPGFTKLYVMDVDGTNITRLTETANAYSPTYSPDGTRIALVNDQTGDGDIYVIDADGQRPFLVTVDDNNAEDRSPVWSPDGQWIVFASNRDGDQFRWWAIDLQGNTYPITVSGRNPQSLSFMSD